LIYGIAAPALLEDLAIELSRHFQVISLDFLVSVRAVIWFRKANGLDEQAERVEQFLRRFGSKVVTSSGILWVKHSGCGWLNEIHPNFRRGV